MAHVTRGSVQCSAAMSFLFVNMYGIAAVNKKKLGEEVRLHEFITLKRINAFFLKSNVS
jgi:hypothetical protein